jgi:hypothetical protein
VEVNRLKDITEIAGDPEFWRRCYGTAYLFKNQLSPDDKEPALAKRKSQVDSYEIHKRRWQCQKTAKLLEEAPMKIW